jgi:hypothetical protein
VPAGGAGQARLTALLDRSIDRCAGFRLSVAEDADARDVPRMKGGCPAHRRRMTGIAMRQDVFLVAVGQLCGLAKTCFCFLELKRYINFFEMR